MAVKTQTTQKKQEPKIENKTTFKVGGRSITFTQEEKIAYILLLVLILVVALIRSKFVNIPYERDEGAYSYYGKLLLEGKIPYKDFYEQKLPGIFYFYAFMISIFGSSVKQMHIGFTFLNIATVLLIFLSVKRLFRPVSAIIAAITFALVSLTPNLSGFTIQAEHGVAFFTSLGIFLYAIASEKKKWFWYFAMGLALGTAFMVKTSGLFMMFWGGLILVLDYIFSKDRSFPLLLRQVAAYCAGAILVTGTLLLLVYAKGSFADMIYWVYELPKYYVNRITMDEGIKYFGYSRDAIVENYKFLWIHGVLAIVLCLLKTVSWKTKMFALSLGATSFLTIVPGFYFYGHYWIQVIPGLAVLSGITCYAVLSFLATQFNLNQPRLKYIYLGVFVLLALMHINKQKNYYFNPNYEQILRRVYGNNPFPESMEIAKYINSIAKPEDQMAVLGSEPQLFIYTNKTSPTRHVFFSTIVAAIPTHKQFQREFVSEIEAVKPKYFIFFRHSVSLLVQANVDQYVFEWANKYLNDNYEVIGVVDMPDGSFSSTYVFGEQVKSFSPTGQNVIYIFQRKDAAKQPALK